MLTTAIILIIFACPKAQSGGMFEATSFAHSCEISHTTISNYLGVMEATFVAHVIRPFSTR